MFGKANSIGPLSANGKGAVSQAERERLIRAVADRFFAGQIDGRTVARSGDLPRGQLADFLFTIPGEPRLPDEVFDRLRWGGLLVYVGSSRAKVRRLAAMFDERDEFMLEAQPRKITAGPMGLRLPGLTSTGYWFAARKTHLIQSGQATDRFTYHVELMRDPQADHGYIVTKQVPTYDNLMYRLRMRFPDACAEDLQARASKFVEHIFPTFLTREAAFLKILERDLPEPYRRRVPTLLNLEKNQRGLVRRIDMNWLRIGGQTISQLEFAQQSAELLNVLHSQAKIMHLDLRLDNFVITDHGVGFVDFGSAVRIGEDLSQSPMLLSLFEEMLRTSQIQRMLGKMLDSGQITNKTITDGHQKIDKAVDSFYLAVQINRPWANPEFGHLIHQDPHSLESRSLCALTAAILRPKHPDKAEFKTAADILRGIRRIEQRISRAAA